MFIPRQTSYALFLCCFVLLSNCLNYSVTSDVNLKGSLIGFTDINVPADGVTPVASWIHVASNSGDPIPEVAVSLLADGIDTIQPLNKTDQDGLAFANLLSKQAGTPIVRANLAYGELRYTLTATDSINFYEIIGDKPDQIRSGKAIHAQISVRTKTGRPDRSYVGHVTFTSTDPVARLPEPYTFAPRDLGHKIWAGGVIFQTPGEQTVEAMETGTNKIVFRQTMQVLLPETERLKIEVELRRSRVTAGRAERLILRLTKPDGTFPTQLPKNLIFECSDKRAVFPELKAWQLQEDGSWIADLYATTVGDHRLLARVGDSTSKLELFSVEPDQIATFALSASSMATAGKAFSLSITALDKFGNVAWGFRGPIALYTTDSNALLPGDLNMGPAQQGMLTQIDGIEIYQSGMQRLWVEADYNNRVVSGEMLLDVAPGSPMAIGVALQQNQSVVNLPVGVLLNIQDAYGNEIPFSGQTVGCQTNDPLAILPNKIELPKDGVSAAFSVSFRTAGPLRLTCSDVQIPTLTGTSTVFTALPGSPERIMIWGYDNKPLVRVLRGYAIKTYVGVVDNYGNVVDTFQGQISLQANSGKVDLQQVVTLQSKDKGKALLQPDVVFRTLGTTSIAAQSVTTNALNGNFDINVQGIEQLSEGMGYSTCAKTTDQITKCWGFNFNGQLGLGDNIYRGSSPGQMGAALPAQLAGSGRTIVALSTGAAATCSITDIGQIICFGDNQSGMLGLGNKLSRGNSIADLQPPLPFVSLGIGRTPLAVRLGVGHGCALLDNKRVKCWGENQNGQLGVGDTNPRGNMPNQMGDNLPYSQPDLTESVQAIAVGQGHTCLLTISGKVACVGDNVYGQLGVGDAIARGKELSNATGAFALLGRDRQMVAIACGANHTCALDNMGQVRCFGENSYGQLGLGDTTPRGLTLSNNRSEIAPVIDLDSDQQVQQMALGGAHTCLLLENGQVVCLGDNRDGKLGVGDTNPRGVSKNHLDDDLAFTLLGKDRRAVQLVAGVAQTCAILDDGRVKCWGSNSLGQLGLGDTIHRGGELGQMNNNLPSVLLDGY